MTAKDFLKGFQFDTGDHSAFPSDTKAMIVEASEIRGWCVQSFAQVEFILAYLVHRAARTFPEYAHLELAYRPDNRPKRVRELLAIEGVLKPHALEIEEILCLLASFEGFRHAIVHGWSDIVRAPNGLFLRYRRYQPTSDKPWGIEITTTTIETLREQRDQLVSFAENAVIYFGKLFMRYNLEEDDNDAMFVSNPSMY